MFAKTDPEPGPRGISGFIVPATSPGFSVARTRPEDGRARRRHRHPRASTTARVPAANLLGGKENEGFKTLMMTLNSVRPIVAARGARAWRRAPSPTPWSSPASARPSAGRSPTFRPSSSCSPTWRSRSRRRALLIYQAAWLVDQGRFQQEDSHFLSIGKAFATETAVNVSSDALQVLGAQGYMRDHPLERHYRDARQLMIVEGTSQIQRVIISRALLDRDLVYP